MLSFILHQVWCGTKDGKILIFEDKSTFEKLEVICWEVKYFNYPNLLSIATEDYNCTRGHNKDHATN